MKRIVKTLLVISLSFGTIFMASSCKRSVKRINPNKQVDLSGRWNDVDARLVAEEMVKDVMARPWHSNHFNKTGKKPVIIVGMVVNKTMDQIEPEVFIKDLEREFINTGSVRVVTNSEFREKIRQERADQQEFASKETAKKWGKELGADYMMFGVINSVDDQYKKRKIAYYKVNLELADIETNEIVWLGEKEIKKDIRN
ncbi:MAG TPA: penicillin-binding protein activator LpoB [Cytophagales bacterium]|nr:penicillin-binding protein activator LpoB [Cytophagales bacterium]